MLKVTELKVADLVIVEYEGKQMEGEVVNVDIGGSKACVLTGEQEFWYDEKHIHPIQLDESQLTKLGFERQANSDGTVKYLKGPFRVLLHTAGNFSDFEIWYREDSRYIRNPIFVHDFQNKYLEMTKVHLTGAEA